MKKRVRGLVLLLLAAALLFGQSYPAAADDMGTQESSAVYSIMVCTSEGSIIRTINISAANYDTTTEKLPAGINSWKLVYKPGDDPEAHLTFTDITTVEEIWTKGISQIEGSLNEGKFVLYAVMEDGTASFTQPGWYVGETPAAPVVSSATNGEGEVAYYYKKAGEEDTAYTKTVPSEAGDYTAKAVFPSKNGYNEVIKTCDFSISYLSPENLYTICGAEGSNGWYTEAVTIYAAEGYAVRKSTDEANHWTGSVSFEQSQDHAVIYLRSTSTGALSDAVSLGNLQVDTKEPVIQGALDGETYYEDSIAIEITDENLSEVIVNGQHVALSNGKAALTLSAAEKNYQIIARDIAGNITKATVAVLGNQMWNRIDFTGNRLLSKGKAYELGHGKWQVSQDPTVYAGEVSFYVEEDGEFYFSLLQN